MKFCTKTKGLSKEQNKEFARDLKAFSKDEAKKFQNEDQESEDQDES